MEIAASGVGALAVGGYAYAGMWPESQIFGKTIVAGKDPAEFALTYDDGPNDPETGLLLELLAKHDVRATFFVMGSYVRQRPEIVRAVAAAGHLVGNHTVTHPKLIFCSAKKVLQELAGCNAALEDALGAPVRYMRCPHGMRRPDVLETARDLGLTAVQWNVAGYDWNALKAEDILENVERGIGKNRRKGNGSNILLHDGGHLSMGQDRRATVAATRLLLERYQGKAKFVTPAIWG